MTRHSMKPVVLLCCVVLACTTDANRSRVRLSIDGNIQTLRRALVVQLITPTWQKTILGSDFGTATAPNYIEALETSTYGTIQTIVRLNDPNGVAKNLGAVSLDIRSDWIWDISIVLDERNPFGVCFGCTGFKAFAVDTVFQQSGGDSLFVVWGGNSINHPAIY